MHEGDLQQRIEQLEQRLAQLEARLGDTEPPIQQATAKQEAPGRLVARTDSGPEPPQEGIDTDVARETSAEPQPPLVAPPTAPPTAPPPTVPPAPKPPAHAAEAPVAQASHADRARDDRRTGPGMSATPMELIIGGRWMAWVGALGVVVAVGFFLKLAYDRGWWSVLAPTTRCLLGGAFGLLLMTGGEIALRRLGRAAAAGLYASGLATLYLVAWAAFGYFRPPLISEAAAFGLMAIVAVVGFAITFRARFLTIGMLSMIGGYATPLIIGGLSGRGIVLPGYLTMLMAIALGLSLVRRRDFRPLRSLALGGQTLIGGAWLIIEGQSHWEMSVVFMSLWWAMLLGESTVAAIRGQSPAGNIAITLIATAAYVTGATWILNTVPPAGGFSWTGLFVAAVAVLGTMVALQFGPGLQTLRGRRRSAMDKLAVALWVQSGALIAIAVAMQFDGYGQSIGWLAISLASIEVARRLPSRGVGVFGVIVGALAISRIVLVDTWINPALHDKLLSFGQVDLTGWGVLMLAAVAAMHVAARRLGDPAAPDSPFRPWVVWPIILACLGTLGWLGLCAVVCRDETVTAAWLIAVAALLAANRLGRRQGYLEIALGALIVTGAKWVLLDAAVPRLTSGWSAADALPLVNVQMALGAAIALAGWWVSIEVRRRIESGDGAQHGLAVLPQLAVVGAALFALVALSFEVERAIGRYEAAHDVLWPALQVRSLWWTGLWALGAMLLIIAGRSPRLGALRFAGWGTLGAAALAWLTIDTIAFRVEAGVVDCMPVLNLQFGIGAVTAGLLAVAVRMLRAPDDLDPAEMQATRHAAAAGMALIGAIGFWLGSLEIDRAFAASPMTVQTGLSIYWGLYAVMLIVAGFARRIAVARYVGIGVFSLTVAKVMIVDMAQVEQIWRVLSCLAVGLLLIGTSILYSKLAPRLLASG